MLPNEVREQINELLIAHNFAGYLDLTEKVNQLLKDSGLELTVSKTGLHRYGKKFEDRLEALRMSTLQAKEMKRLLADDDAAVAEMSLQLSQGLIFDLMIERGQDLSAKEIGLLSRALSDASRAGIGVKKYQAELKAKVDEAFKKIERENQKTKTLDRATLARVRSEIYGLL